MLLFHRISLFSCLAGRYQLRRLLGKRHRGTLVLRTSVCAAHLHHGSFAASAMEEVLKRTVVPLPAYEIQHKSPPVPESNCMEFINFYRSLETPQKVPFLEKLSQEFGVDHQAVAELALKLVDSPKRDAATVLQAEDRLRYCLTPRYQALFGHISRVEGGIKFLLDLRGDVIEALDAKTTESPHIQGLNSILKSMILEWFSVGLLKLERITWKSPCELLQKISQYERFYPVRNWTDIKHRVGPYRRCYAFTNGAMPGEPLLFLHVALTEEIPDNIQQFSHSQIINQGMSWENFVNVLRRWGDGIPGCLSLSTHLQDKRRRRRGAMGFKVGRIYETIFGEHNSQEITEDENKIKAAIFYSISSAHVGLPGEELGYYLVKQAVRELQSEFPSLDQFSSLSPLLGFTVWLLGLLNQQRNDGRGRKILMDSEWREIERLVGSPAPERLHNLLSTNEWVRSEELIDILKPILMRLCGWYLYGEKLRSYALDGAANFHLQNGATIWRLNWKADMSPRGISASCGMMVNYRYFLPDTGANSAKYLRSKVIEASEQILNLVSQFQQNSKL